MKSKLVIDRRTFIALVRHIGWVNHQIGARQEYNLLPTDDQLISTLDGVDFFDRNPGCTLEENHENWMKGKLADGWVYGTVKNNVKKTHPDLVPFNELPVSEITKDVSSRETHKLAARLWENMHE